MGTRRLQVEQLKEAFWTALGLPTDRTITVRNIVSIPFARAEADLNRVSVLEADPGGEGPVRRPVSAFMVGQLLDPIRAAFTDLDRVSRPAGGRHHDRSPAERSPAADDGHDGRSLPQP